MSINFDKTFNGDTSHIIDDMVEKIAKYSMESNPLGTCDEIRKMQRTNKKSGDNKSKNVRRICHGSKSFKKLLEDKIERAKDSNSNLLQSIFFITTKKRKKLRKFSFMEIRNYFLL